MHEIDNRYAAGFFDGEGCVRIHNRSLCVRLTGAFKPGLIDLFVKKWKGCVIIEKRKNITHRDTVAWYIYNNEAYVFLNDILPHTYEKSDQIKLALNYYKIKMNASNKYYIRENNGYVKIDKETADFLEILDKKLRLMKKIRHIYDKTKIMGN